MTWGEWVNSEYNTFGWEYDSAYGIYIISRDVCLSIWGGNVISSVVDYDDKIRTNYSYYISDEDGFIELSL